tara:strand:+ start:118 stop:432 length:315 start_codon:yes stop_codon:yes gene_type:complete
MIIYVDIDETICKSPEDRNYSMAKPIVKNIQKINKLYDEGNTIVYWTARGTGSGIDWSGTTKEQFIQWGVKCHDIKFGKPIYDLFIDDKNINSETFFNKEEKVL